MRGYGLQEKCFAFQGYKYTVKTQMERESLKECLVFF